MSNFASRLHQLPTGIVDLDNSDIQNTIFNSNSFIGEMFSYNNAPTGLLVSWTKEYNKKYLQLTHNGEVANFYIKPLAFGVLPQGYFQLYYNAPSPYLWHMFESIDTNDWVFFNSYDGSVREFFDVETPFYFKVIGVDISGHQTTLESNSVFLPN